MHNLKTCEFLPLNSDVSQQSETIIFIFRFNTSMIETATGVDIAMEALHKGNDSIVRYVLDMEKIIAA